MREPVYLWLTCLGLILAAGCQQKREVVAAVSRPATIDLRDGSRISGQVLYSSASRLTLKNADGTTRDLDMQNVRSVDYGPDVNPVPPPVAQGGLLPPHYDGMPTPPRFHPDESHITTRKFLLPQGTQVQVRTDETIDSLSAVEGQTYAAEIYRDVLDPDGAVVLPQGANAQLSIMSATRGGRIEGTSDLLVDLTSVSVGGRRYSVVSSTKEERGKEGVGANRRTAEFVGGASALGTIIGAIAGHGKGAAIGAGAGAGAGTVAEVATKGETVRIPAETILTFRLEQLLRVSPAVR